MTLDTMLNARQELARIDAQAYLEMHIEQGPVLESMNHSAGVVLGTFGWSGTWCGSSARPRTRFYADRDAARRVPGRRGTALECREIAQAPLPARAGVVCTVGVVKVEPGIVTAVPGVAEIRSISGRWTRSAGGDVREAQEASRRFAAENDVSVEWRPLFRIEPRPFDPHLLQSLRGIGA